MWLYEKRLQYPVNVRKPDAKTAKIVISQLGGPNGELGAALRYLSQRYTMPYPRIQALLTDIGTEELAHVEIISTLFYQLTNGLTPQEIKDGGLDAYFTDHTLGVYPTNSAGIPFSADTFQSVGDPITDLTEDMAAEQKAYCQLGRRYIHIVLADRSFRRNGLPHRLQRIGIPHVA